MKKIFSVVALLGSLGFAGCNSCCPNPCNQCCPEPVYQSPCCPAPSGGISGAPKNVAPAAGGGAAAPACGAGGKACG
jgi:hypothetical protein